MAGIKGLCRTAGDGVFVDAESSRRAAILCARHGLHKAAQRLRMGPDTLTAIRSGGRVKQTTIDRFNAAFAAEEAELAARTGT